MRLVLRGPGAVPAAAPDFLCRDLLPPAPLRFLGAGVCACVAGTTAAAASPPSWAVGAALEALLAFFLRRRADLGVVCEGVAAGDEEGFEARLRCRFEAEEAEGDGADADAEAEADAVEAVDDRRCFLRGAAPCWVSASPAPSTGAAAAGGAVDCVGAVEASTACRSPTHDVMSPST